MRNPSAIQCVSKKQSPLASLTESVVNTASGLLVAFFAQYLICLVYNIKLFVEENVIITLWMTVFSLVRDYLFQCAWNSEFWKNSFWQSIQYKDEEPF